MSVFLRFSCFILGVTKLAGLCTLALVMAFACWDSDILRAQELIRGSDQAADAEKAAYADALIYCRGDVPRPEALRADKRVFCLDGRFSYNHELLLANGLGQGGLFLVRSQGGDVASIIALADLLLLKQATVVINDYCLAQCADYLFIATAKTYVPKGALVAWTVQASAENSCIGFLETPDPRAPRLREAPCVGSGSFADVRNESLKGQFYYGRVVAAPHQPPEQPPESVAVRKILKRKFDETGKFPENVYWTWNPRYYASAIRTKVLYEAYPQGQDEVDAIVRQLGLSFSVVYDP